MKFKAAEVGEEVVLDSYFLPLDYCGIPTPVLKVTNPKDPSTKLEVVIRGKRFTVYDWQVASLKHEPERAQDAIRRRRLRCFHERSGK